MRARFAKALGLSLFLFFNAYSLAEQKADSKQDKSKPPKLKNLEAYNYKGGGLDEVEKIEQEQKEKEQKQKRRNKNRDSQ